MACFWKNKQFRIGLLWFGMCLSGASFSVSANSCYVHLEQTLQQFWQSSLGDSWAACAQAPLEQSMQIEANRLSYQQEDNFFSANGQVRLLSQQYCAQADYAQHRSEALHLQGDVRFKVEDFYGKADTLSGNSNLQQAQATNLSFLSLIQTSKDPQYFWGNSQEFLKSDQKYELKNASFSFCPDTKRGWNLEAEQIDLNYERQEGRILGGRVVIADYPLMRLPDFSFPLSDARRSGLLPPSFGVDDDRGAFFRVPYYFNLAPNYDLKAQLSYYPRDWLFGLNFRHLNQQGSLDAVIEFLPSDSITGQNRWATDAKYYWSQPELGVAVQLNYRRVSDAAYFLDVDSQLLGSKRYNRQYFSADWHSKKGWSTGHWNFSYEQHDPLLKDENQDELESELYGLKPQLKYTRKWGLWDQRLKASLNAQWARFSLGSDDVQDRLVWVPKLTWPLQADSWKSQVSVAWYARHYHLQSNQSASFGVPQLYASFSKDAQTSQVMRPDGMYQNIQKYQLAYVYVPFEAGQEELPDLDTFILPLLSFKNMFAARTFGGFDRVTNANYLVWGVENQWMRQQDSQVLWSWKVSQRIHLAQQRVFLEDSILKRDRNFPDTFVETDWKISPSWSMSAALLIGQRDAGSSSVYNQQNLSKIQDGQIFLNYQQDQPSRIRVQFAHTRLQSFSKFRQDWRVSGQWLVRPNISLAVHGRWVQKEISSASQRKNFLSRLQLGLSYQACCWGVGVLIQHRENVEATRDSLIFFQVQLNGLGRIGREMEQLLSKNIPGYRSIFN